MPFRGDFHSPKCGNRNHMYSVEGDWYSIGAVAYNLLTISGKRPTKDLHNMPLTQDHFSIIHQLSATKRALAVFFCTRARETLQITIDGYL